MVNAWSLLYSEMNGTMDEDYPIMSKDEDVIVLGETSNQDTISFTAGTDFFGGSDTVSLDQSWWTEDGFSVTGNPTASPDTLNLGPTRLPGGMGDDHLSLGYDAYPTMDSINWASKSKPKPNLKGPSHRKYQEDKGLRDLSDYVCSTYNGHYTNNNSDVQTLDLIHSVGDAESFCRSNAIKYLSRYDKKGQAKRDILKALHYSLLLYHFSGQLNETPTRGYETF